jgi:hypothetical protein
MGSKRDYHWAITVIRQKVEFLGYVRAPDRDTATQEAIKHFEIKGLEQQTRLMVQRAD